MDKIIEIAKLRGEHKTYKEIGEILGFSKQRVHQLFKGYHSNHGSYRLSILLRDDFKCQICNNPKNLEVHHINGRNVEDPDNPNNLATVCKKCHLRIDAEDRKTIRKPEIKYFMSLKSQYRERVIEEYNKTITETRHPSYSEIAKVVGCSKMTVAVFIRQYKASLGKDAQ